MEILYIDEVASTQEYLKNELKNEKLNTPICVVATKQISGIGSRGNSWDSVEGNLFFSFALNINYLPKDLKIESASIYFATIMKVTLAYYGSNIHIKWPNDFYINDKKIGGIITSKVGENIICGIGINTKKAPNEFGVLDTVIDNQYILRDFFNLLDKKISWEQCFNNYKDDFEFSKNLSTNINGKSVSLKNAILLDDGSIKIEDEIIYSLR